MNTFVLAYVGGIVAAALLASGCAPAIPQGRAPDGWELNVHQAGEWWTQPLIPHAVAHFSEHDGHYSLPVTHAEQILTTAMQKNTPPSERPGGLMTNILHSLKR